MIASILEPKFSISVLPSLDDDCLHNSNTPPPSPISPINLSGKQRSGKGKGKARAPDASGHSSNNLKEYLNKKHSSPDPANQIGPDHSKLSELTV